MTTASNDLTTIRPTAEIIAFPAGGRRAYLMDREAERGKELVREAEKMGVPMIRGCWYHEDAINETEVKGTSH